MQNKRLIAVVGLIAVSIICPPRRSLASEGRPPEARLPFASAQAKSWEPPEHAFDLQHVRIEVAFDLDAGRVLGRTTQTFAPLGDATSILRLDAIDLDIASVVDGRGRSLEFAVEGQSLEIDLGSPPRDAVEVTITYTATPERGLFFTRPDPYFKKKPLQLWTQGEMEDTRAWLPIWDHPNDRATSEVIVTVPESWTAISNGRLVGTKQSDDGATRTFHWKQEIPHVTYLITIAAGEFEKVEENSPSGVELTYYVPLGRSEQIPRSFGKTAGMMKFFSDWLDVPYPWAKYAQVVVHDFTYGGMENTSATTLTERTLHNERAHLDYRSDGLVAHELAHQWFGDLITCKTWAHNWLNEGFATYFETLWNEHDEGADEFAATMRRKADSYIEEDTGKYRRAIVETRYDDAGTLFDAHAYSKGAWVLHMLRNEVGEVPFRRGIQHWVKSHRERVVETEQFRLAFEEATGRSLRWFFDQWVYKAGYPKLAVESRYDATSGMLVVRLRQTQDTSGETPLFRLPIVLRLWTETGHKDYRIDLQGKDQVMHLPSARKPLGLTVDPGHHVLVELDYSPSLDYLATQLERSDAAIDRLQAVRLLKTRRGDRVATLLGDTLANDPFWAVRGEAARALGKVGGQTALDALVAALGDPDSRVRTAAADGLGELEDRGALGALTKVLGNDESYYARAEAAKSIGRIGGDGAYGKLRSALSQSSFSDIVRKKAFEGLTELGDDRALKLAKKWTAVDRPPTARSAAMSLLGKLGKGKHGVLGHLLEILEEDPFHWARRSAARALGDLGDPEAIEPLTTAVATEWDSRLRRDARRSIALLKRARASTTGKADLSEIESRLDALESRVESLGSGFEEK